jgi:hypothetical protein
MELRILNAHDREESWLPCVAKKQRGARCFVEIFHKTEIEKGNIDESNKTPHRSVHEGVE